MAAVGDRDRSVARDEIIRQVVGLAPLVLLVLATNPRFRLWWSLKLAQWFGPERDPAESDRAAMQRFRRDLSLIANSDLSGLDEIDFERWGDMT
jgi:hypothetical protein